MTKRENDERKNPPSQNLDVGVVLEYLFYASLGVIGGFRIFSIFKPELVENGVEYPWYLNLAPGAILAIFLILQFVKWMDSPACDPEWTDNGVFEKRPDGRYFGFTTKIIVATTLCLIIVSLLLLLNTPLKIQGAEKYLWFYVLLLHTIFLLYLSVGFRPEKHRVVTTYLNQFSPFIGTILIPLTWPLILIFSMRTWRGSAPRDRNQRA